MATVAATKTISFKSPYTGATFQNYTTLLTGRDGYISGGLTTDNGATVTVQPTTFLQRGLLVSSTVAAAGIPVPTAAEPWFVLAGTFDDDPDSGATFTATADLATAINSVVVAVRSGGIWTNPVSVNIAAAAERDSDAGVEEDLGIFDQRAVAGTVTTMDAFKGLIVDPAGKRRSLKSLPTNSGKAFSAAPNRPNVAFDRNDHLIVRQNESFTPEVRAILGGALYPNQPPILLDAGALLVHASYFAKRGGAVGEQWWAWGFGANLRIKGGPAGEAFATATLLSGTAITATWIPGQRASDSAVILLYVDGLNLRLTSFNPTTGVSVNAPVTIEPLGGQISHVRAVLDRNESLHIAFEHDEGPRQQVYYAKVRILTGASFGTAEVAPQIVNGLDSGFDDTWPSIGVDRRGTVTVAYVRGVGGNEFGDLVVATIDQQGDTVSQDIVFAASDVAVDNGDPAGTGLPGRGASPLAFLNLRRTAVVVTPHDELYVFTIGLSAGTLPNYVLAYTPNLERDYGSKLINVLPKELPLFEFVGIAAAAGEGGEIFLGYKRKNTTTVESFVHSATFGTPIFQDGKIPIYLFSGQLQFQATVDAFDDMDVRPGPLGEFVTSYKLATNGYTIQAAPYAEAPGTSKPQRHPKDLYLGTWTVPKSASATLDGHGKRFETFNTRSKKMNYPIVVGKNGDYQGFNSLAEAFTRVSRDGGGDVVLRPGIHRVTTGMSLLSGGFSIRGEGAATIVADTAAGFWVAGGSPSSAVTVSGNVITDTGLDLAQAVPGDILEMDVSGEHVVLRNLGPHPSTGLPRVLVENSAAGVPAGATGHLFASGIRYENLTFVLTVFSGIPLTVMDAHRPLMRNIRLEGATSTGITFQDCIEPLIDGIDLTRVVNTDANSSLVITSTTSVRGGIVRNARFADGKGKFVIGSMVQDVHLINCSSDGADASKVIYAPQAARTTPIWMTNCEGRIASLLAADLAFLITNVGKRLRLPEAGGALEFEDDNTRASAIVDDGIKLSSVAHKQFDGASPDVITHAVNERLIAAGDTMLGTLLMGPNLLSTAADARIPRLSVPHSGSVGIPYTLVWESLKDIAGEDVRLYVSYQNVFTLTVNASWDGANWNKDLNGQEARQVELANARYRVSHQDAGTNTWADGAWLVGSDEITNQLNLYLGTALNYFAFAQAALTHRADIIPQATNTYKIGSSTVQPSKVWTRRLALGPDPTDYPNGRSMVIKSDHPSSTVEWDGEYISRRFGMMGRKGYRLFEDFDKEALNPPGWDQFLAGAANGGVSFHPTVPHTLKVEHDGAGTGQQHFHTDDTIKFRLTDGFLFRARIKIIETFGVTRIGFYDVLGNLNGITFGHVTPFIGYNDLGFRVGGTGELGVGGTSHLTGNDLWGAGFRWVTFGLTGTTLFWVIDTTEPDPEILEDGTGVPTDVQFGHTTIVVPTGLFNLDIISLGFTGGASSEISIDCIEVITGSRDG